MGKLYVITREDLELQYQGVQAGHGLAAWMLDNPDHEWQNSTLVYLSVDDEEHLKRWEQKLSVRGYEFSKFHEPDIGNELTAVACYTDTNIFSSLRKMGDKKSKVYA